VNTPRNEKPISKKTFYWCVNIHQNSYHYSLHVKTLVLGCLSRWKFNNASWIHSSSGTLEILFFFGLSDWWSFLARMMPSSNAMHPPCTRARDVGWEALPQIVTYQPLEFHKLVSRLLRVKECFWWNVWRLCCWCTIQVLVFESIWWIEGPLVWFALVFCFANLKRWKVSQIITKLLHNYVLHK